MTALNEMQRAAVEYDEQGLFPLAYVGKRPIWREREWTRLALERFFQHAEGIGIDCGRCKPPRVVVDYDKEEGREYGRSICDPAGVIVKSTHGFHDHYGERPRAPYR